MNQAEGAASSPERLALFAAAMVSVVSGALVVSSGAHLLHYDAKAHLVVARRVLDSVTPGWIQLGAVWLPLPHILNAVPARSDFLYRTGLFAAALGLVAFLLGLVALARAARLATGDGWAAAIAVAVPALNPGWLYLEATPLTEPLFLGLVASLALFVVRWRRARRPRDLVLAATFSALACLVRYEAWPIAAGAAVAAFWRLPAPPSRREIVRRWLPLMLGLGLFAPIVFFAWHSWYSTERFFYVIDSSDLTRPHGDLGDSILLLLLGTADAFGPPMTLLALACLAVLVWRRRSEAPLALALAGPAAVTFFAYLAGHPAKARYALLLAPAFALAVALATSGRRIVQLGALAVAAAQPLTVPSPLPVIAEAMRGRPDELARQPEVEAFRHEYQGGRILASMGSAAPLIFELQIPIREILHEGNGAQWEYGAVDPARHVRWVLIEPGDILDQIRAYRPRFPEGFVPVGRIGQATLYAPAAAASERRARRGAPALTPSG
jgi:hypothetical protein